MDIQNILNEITANLTGDPEKDGPYLKEQSEKYSNTEFSQELDREFARIIFEISEKNYKETLDNFLDVENKKISEQLENAEKRFNNRNFNGGLKILEEIIKNNIFAWNDTSEVTYKCFGTPLEYMLYKTIFEDPENAKTIKPVNCDLAKVYWMYCHGLTKAERYDEAYKAIERARELNPCDPEVYVHYAELAKFSKNPDALKMSAEMLLKVAVSKVQVGRAYFNYSFYYSEMQQYDKALALLQMNKIFAKSDLFESELEFIASKMNSGYTPKMYTTDELMNILIAEGIQAGPSANVVAIANKIAGEFETNLELKYAKYFYEIVYELTEDVKTYEHLEELSKSINNINDFHSL